MATPHNNTPHPTDAELAQAFRDLEGAIYNLRNMADLCTATIESETQPWPLPGGMPSGLRAINDQSVDRIVFSTYHLEGMIRSFAEAYLAIKFPKKAA